MNKRFGLTQQELKIAVPIHGAILKPLIFKYISSICSSFQGLWAMVFNATFNNISVITWLSVLLVEETRVHGETH